MKNFFQLRVKCIDEPPKIHCPLASGLVSIAAPLHKQDVKRTSLTRRGTALPYGSLVSGVRTSCTSFSSEIIYLLIYWSYYIRRFELSRYEVCRNSEMLMGVLLILQVFKEIREQLLNFSRKSGEGLKLVAKVQYL